MQVIDPRDPREQRQRERAERDHRSERETRERDQREEVPLFLSEFAHLDEILRNLGKTLLALVLDVPRPVDLWTQFVKAADPCGEGKVGFCVYKIFIDLSECLAVIPIELHLFPQLGWSVRSFNRFDVKIADTCVPEICVLSKPLNILLLHLSPCSSRTVAYCELASGQEVLVQRPL